MTIPRMTRVTGKLGESLRTDAQPGIVIPLVKNMLLAKHGPDLERRTDVVHPSEMAKPNWCARATWLRIKGDLIPPVEKFDFFQQNIFGEGNTIHAKWQGWLADTGQLWGSWKCKTCGIYADNTNKPESYFTHPCLHEETHLDWEYKEVHMMHGLVAGHSDGALLEANCLIEIKSVGLGSIRIDAPEFLARYQKDGKTDLTGLWKGLERPLKSHLKQGDVYLWLANKIGLPFDKIVYLYEFKANQLVKEFTIPYNEERVKPLIDKVDLIEDAIENDNNVPCSISQQGCDQCRAEKPRRVRNVVR
jgi:hypothetical protein